MVVLKLKKTFPMTFVSNQDFQRAFRRTLTRANIEVAYSEGFNPHMQVDFTPPVPLGMDSVAEYVVVDTAVAPDELMASVNAHAPQGLYAQKAFFVDRFNPARVTVANGYEMNIDSEIAGKILAFAQADEVTISYVDRGKEVAKQVADKILSAGYADGKLALVLSAGNDNLRADRLVESAGRAIGETFRVIDLVKTETYLSVDGELVSFENFLDGRV